MAINSCVPRFLPQTKDILVLRIFPDSLL